MSGSPSIAVLTATLPERSRLLDECRASVEAQTVQVEHLVGVDQAREGPSTIRNRLAAATDADWLLPLDDDDLLDPDCVEVLSPYLTDDVDVVYPWCRVQGSDWHPNRLFNADTLLVQGNFIPVTAMIRHTVWDQVGGMPQADKYEDWMFFKRCLGAGAVFKCVPEVVWTYRIDESGTSRNQKAA